MAELLKPASPSTCALQQEATTVKSPPMQLETSPHSPQLEKSPGSDQKQKKLSLKSHRELEDDEHCEKRKQDTGDQKHRFK